MTIPPLVNKRELLKLGFTPGLITALLGAPDLVKHHKQGSRHWVEHLYARDRVTTAVEDARFVARLAKRKQRAAAAMPSYSTWREALLSAVAALYSLNRYAKHVSCSGLTKFEIYRLKNQFLELLYMHGYCTASWVHRIELPAQLCRECSGDGERCGHCCGSGIWREAKTLEFWCFRFAVEGKSYCWHQPRSTVKFSPTESVPPQDWDGPSPEQPYAMLSFRVNECKQLLQWVIDRASAQQEEESATDTLQPPCGEPNEATGAR